MSILRPASTSASICASLAFVVICFDNQMSVSKSDKGCGLNYLESLPFHSEVLKALSLVPVGNDDIPPIGRLWHLPDSTTPTIGECCQKCQTSQEIVTLPLSEC